MLDDWDITHVRRDLPPAVWRFLKEKGFFGLIVPRRYGGLEFSAQAHSAVVMKIASRSVTAAVTVMVPNSLGPAELLLHYGTEAQRTTIFRAWRAAKKCRASRSPIPRPAPTRAPCPTTAWYAAANWTAKRMLGIRAELGKSATSPFGPVATGGDLAFKLHDPDHLWVATKTRYHAGADSHEHARRQNRHAPQSAQHPVPERP